MVFEVLIKSNKDNLVTYRYVVDGINELDTILTSFKDLDTSTYHIEIKTVKGDK